MELRQKQNELLLVTLRDRNNLFAAFMNNGPFVSYIKDYDGHFVY
jgi:hypothetical protein